MKGQFYQKPKSGTIHQVNNIFLIHIVSISAKIFEEESIAT